MSNEKIDILYEDKDCLVLNKPAGLMVHPDGRNEGPFLTDWLIKNYPELKDVGEEQRSPEGKVLDRPGIVHRLDKDTSGALLIARSPEAHAFLKAQFQNRTVAKKYLAFVWGEFAEDFGTITRAIGRNWKNGPRWSAASRGTRGEMREAETYWSKLWSGKVGEDKFSLIQAEPKTGRTHQIRVHLLAEQHPIVADEMYASTKPKALGFERLALHSWKLQFQAPSGKDIKIEAPLPEDFRAALEKHSIVLR